MNSITNVPNKVPGDGINNISPQTNNLEERSSSSDLTDTDDVLAQPYGNYPSGPYFQNDFFDWQEICGIGA